jgi:hypothetical protein
VAVLLITSVAMFGTSSGIAGYLIKSFSQEHGFQRAVQSCEISEF